MEHSGKNRWMNLSVPWLRQKAVFSSACHAVD